MVEKFNEKEKAEDCVIFFEFTYDAYGCVTHRHKNS